MAKTISDILRAVTLCLSVTNAYGQDRHLTSELNPGCSDCDPHKRPLIYSRAQGSDDTIHQIWDFTDHIPTIVYIIGTPNSTLNILWIKSIPDKFEFSNSPAASYSFAAAIESIIEYNDLQDNGEYVPDIRKNDKRYWPLHLMSWTLMYSIFTEKEAIVTLRGENHRSPGAIEMKLDIFSFENYASELPHLIHTSNSTLIDIRLVNLTENRKFNSSRFALRLVLVSKDPPWGSWSKNVRKSLNDEHTPGVFKMIEILSSRIPCGGFLQFRPVAYTEPKRGVLSSTHAYITNFNAAILPRRGILRDLYRDYFVLHYYYRDNEPLVDLVIQDAVVSFGLSGDGFYKNHNFTAWSFTIGYGTPPVESLSLFFKTIISIELGVSMTLSGVLCIVVRWKRWTPAVRLHKDH